MRLAIGSVARALAPAATFRPLAMDGRGIRARLKDNNFDALRVVFASMVVFFHMGFLSGQPGLAWMPRYVSATFAVQAFFVVSGFLVTMSFDRSSSLRSYFLKRVRRIFPAYITVVVGAAVLLAPLSTLPASAYFASSGFREYLVSNLLLLNFRAPTLPGVFQSNLLSAVNASLWTIKVEVTFYLTVPVIVWLVRKYGYRRVLATLFVLSVAWHCLFEALSGQAATGLSAKLAKQLPGQLSFFAGGAWAYYSALEGRGPRGTLAAVGAFLYALSSGLVNTAVAPLAVTALVWWAALAGPRLPPLGKHGDFSYGIYLYHFPIVQALIAVGLFGRSPLLAVAVAIACVAVCSIASWYFIEAPALSGRAQHALQARGSLAS